MNDIKQFVKDTIASGNLSILGCVPESISKDHEFMLELWRINPNVVHWLYDNGATREAAYKLFDTPEVLMYEIMRENPGILLPRLKDIRKAYRGINNGSLKGFYNDKELMLKLMEMHNDENYGRCSYDNEFFNCNDLYRKLSKRLKRDRDIIYEANQYNHIFKDIEDEVLDEISKDKEFMIKTLSRFGCDIKYVYDRVKDDDDIVDAAIIQGNGFRCLPASGYDSEELMMSALKKGVNADTWYSCLSNRLKNDENFIFEAAKINSELKHPQYFPKRMLDDTEFMFSLVKENAEYAKYASERLRNDLSFIDLVINSRGFLKLAKVTYDGLSAFSETLVNDKERMMLVLEKLKRTSNEYRIRDLFNETSECLRADEEFIKFAAKRGYNISNAILEVA